MKKPAKSLKVLHSLGSHGVAAMLIGSLRGISAADGMPALDFVMAQATCATVITQLNPEDPRRARVSLLTEGERDCLRLVFQHMTSKDIARQLHVSHHAVDMRLRNAIRKLEVQNRIEAARMLMALEGVIAATTPVSTPAADYQALIYQAPELEDSGPTGDQQEPVSTNPGALPPRLNDPNLLEPGPLATAAHQMQFKPGVGPSGGFLAQPGAPTGNVKLGASLGSTIVTEWPGVAAPDPGDNARPFLATKPWGAKNELAIGHRLGWIMFIAFGSAMTFGGVLAAFAALKSLI